MKRSKFSTSSTNAKISEETSEPVHVENNYMAEEGSDIGVVKRKRRPIQGGVQLGVDFLQALR